MGGNFSQDLATGGVLVAVCPALQGPTGGISAHLGQESVKQVLRSRIEPLEES